MSVSLFLSLNMTEQGTKHFEDMLRAALRKGGDSPVVTPEQMVSFGVELLRLMNAFIVPKERQQRIQRAEAPAEAKKGDCQYGCISQLQKITGFSRPSIYEIIYKNKEQIRTLRTNVSSGRARYNVSDFLAVCERNGRHRK